MIEWVALLDSDLDAHLRGVAFGRRCDGEVSTCGRYLVARLRSPHPLRPDSLELYGRSVRFADGQTVACDVDRVGGWSIKSLHPTRERARAEAERQRALDERAGGVPC